MTIEQKINAFTQLGSIFKEAAESKTTPPQNIHSKKLVELATKIHVYNGWFTEDNILNAYRSWAQSLTNEKLKKWLSNYEIKEEKLKNVGLIMAGNIPMVGFHDMMCVLLSGNNVTAKASGDDAHLPKLVAFILMEIEPLFKERIIFVEGQLKTLDAIIATGSNNSSRYFEFYFSKYPHIIRKNRNSVAVLNGTETPEELKLLGHDIFDYFGLGCRNVSKLFVPEGYNFDNVFGAIFDHKTLLQHNKYTNNYEYNKTVYLMHSYKLLENGFLLLKEDIGLSSPVAVMYYEYYKNEDSIAERLHMDAPHIQCIVSNVKNLKNAIGFGQTQMPELWDYADGVDTMKFLGSV